MLASVLHLRQPYVKEIKIKKILPAELTSRLETNDPANFDQRSEHHHVSWYSRFVLHNPKALYLSSIFKNNTARPFFVHTLFAKEECLYRYVQNVYILVATVRMFISRGLDG